ncbi:MAG: Gfo/Idh/MocA family oxidoreductase [Candidatus Omnitrophica bacterium]|nr:Gfo/Idh/MocA family oxidoreductase [Candidatus Omnitrophota bacterium]
MDFRDLLGRHDIDAVLIATPDHWHGIITALACKSGKDVYVEKPFTHNIREGRLAVQAARANSRVTQLGCQVHASLGYHKAVEIIQSGALGTITQARAWLSSNQAPRGLENRRMAQSLKVWITTSGWDLLPNGLITPIDPISSGDISGIMVEASWRISPAT